MFARRILGRAIAASRETVPIVSIRRGDLQCLLGIGWAERAVASAVSPDLGSVRARHGKSNGQQTDEHDKPHVLCGSQERLRAYRLI